MQHRHQPPGDGAKADQPDRSSRQLPEIVRDLEIEVPALAGAGQGVQLRQAAECRQHQQEGHLRDGLGIRPRHVADGDTTAAGSIEVDCIDPYPDLLDQFEPTRGIDHRRRHWLEHVQQHIGIAYFSEERVLVGFGDDNGV